MQLQSRPASNRTLATVNAVQSINAPFALLTLSRQSVFRVLCRSLTAVMLLCLSVGA